MSIHHLLSRRYFIGELNCYFQRGTFTVKCLHGWQLIQNIVAALSFTDFPPPSFKEKLSEISHTIETGYDQMRDVIILSWVLCLKNAFIYGITSSPDQYGCLSLGSHIPSEI